MAKEFLTKGPRSMSREDYDAIPAVRWTTLKELRRSPLHYKWRAEHEREDSTRLLLGRGVHTAILEPDQFLLDYALFEGERRQGKAWDACVEFNEGKSILKGEEYRLCLAIRDAVRGHPVAGPYLAKGRAEQVLTWKDEKTGLLCKARLDWIGSALVDVKSASSVDAREFGSTSARMGYHSQLAFYQAGLRAVGSSLPAKLIAVEIAPPHDVAVFDVGADAQYAGEEECGELMRRLAECRELGHWPGRYPVNEETLDLPKWAFPDDEEADGLGLEFPVVEG